MEPSTGQPRPHQSTFRLLATKAICLTFYKRGDISYQLDGLKIEALERLRSVWEVRGGIVTGRIAYRLSTKQILITHPFLLLCIVYRRIYAQRSCVRIPLRARDTFFPSPKRPAPL